MIDVVLLHDASAVRTGVRSILSNSQQLQLSFSTDTVADAASALKERPDAVFLTDLWVEGQRTFALMKRSSRCVLFTELDNPTYIAQAIVYGARDLLPMASDSEAIVQRLEGAGGNDALPGPEFRQVLEVMHSNAFIDVAPADKLTQRECQVLRCLSFGLSNAEIGIVCGISVETVKQHVSHMLRKIRFKDRAEAAAWYVRKIEMKK